MFGRPRSLPKRPPGKRYPQSGSFITHNLHSANVKRLYGASGGCPGKSRSLQSVLSQRKKRDGTLHKHPSDAMASGKPSARRQSRSMEITKSLDPKEFNAMGRCTKYHQSPWDLKIYLAVSDAYMKVGCTEFKSNDQKHHHFKNA